MDRHIAAILIWIVSMPSAWSNGTSDGRPDFETFKADIEREPGPNGVYIVDGDTVIVNERRLREFWSRLPTASQAGRRKKVALEGTRHAGPALDSIWSPTDRRDLTYCVSTAFGTQYAAVRDALEEAAGDWSLSADLNFRHVPSEDDHCTRANAHVMFDVRPTRGRRFLARAFAPNDPRYARSIKIDEKAFADPMGGENRLLHVLRHELGHVLGLRHEFVRAEGARVPGCFEGFEWRAITPYDAQSVMQYPQCSGRERWNARLSDFDRLSVVCLYGAQGDTPFDLTICNAPAPVQAPGDAPNPVTTRKQGVLPHEGRRGIRFGPYPLDARFGFVARLSPTAGHPEGNADLYVKFDGHASRSDFDCRPLLEGTTEKCEIFPPGDPDFASVYVRWVTDTHFDLEVQYVPKAE